MSLPDEYLELSIRNVLAISGHLHPHGVPCDVETVVAAVHALDKRIAKEDAARAANDAEWLADAVSGLSTSLERPDK